MSGRRARAIRQAAGLHGKAPKVGTPLADRAVSRTRSPLGRELSAASTRGRRANERRAAITGESIPTNRKEA